eukprot:s5419_g11.t1
MGRTKKRPAAAEAAPPADATAWPQANSAKQSRLEAFSGFAKAEARAKTEPAALSEASVEQPVQWSSSSSVLPADSQGKQASASALAQQASADADLEEIANRVRDQGPTPEAGHGQAAGSQMVAPEFAATKTQPFPAASQTTEAPDSKDGAAMDAEAQQAPHPENRASFSSRQDEAAAPGFEEFLALPSQAALVFAEAARAPDSMAGAFLTASEAAASAEAPDSKDRAAAETELDKAADPENGASQTREDGTAKAAEKEEEFSPASSQAASVPAASHAVSAESPDSRDRVGRERETETAAEFGNVVLSPTRQRETALVVDFVKAPDVEEGVIPVASQAATDADKAPDSKDCAAAETQTQKAADPEDATLDAELAKAADVEEGGIPAGSQDEEPSPRYSPTRTLRRMAPLTSPLPALAASPAADRVLPSTQLQHTPTGGCMESGNSGSASSASTDRTLVLGQQRKRRRRRVQTPGAPRKEKRERLEPWPEVPPMPRIAITPPPPQTPSVPMKTAPTVVETAVDREQDPEYTLTMTLWSMIYVYVT